MGTESKEFLLIQAGLLTHLGPPGRLQLGSIAILEREKGP